jgi:hypothetical protein
VAASKLFAGLENIERALQSRDCGTIVAMSLTHAGPHGRVLVSHTSAAGPMATHVRGTVVANALENIRLAGAYDEYMRVMPEPSAKALLELLPVSWIPIEHVTAHYTAVDKLGLSRAQFAEIGQRNAQRIAETFMGLLIKQVRSLGVDTLKQTVLKLGSVHDRMWRGGGCAVIEQGPKDLLFEFHGCPFAHSRAFRAGYETYGQALAEAFCKVAYVRLVRPQLQQTNALALSLNWV